VGRCFIRSVCSDLGLAIRSPEDQRTLIASSTTTGIAINMRLAGADTGFRQQIIDRYSSQAGVHSVADVGPADSRRYLDQMSVRVDPASVSSRGDGESDRLQAGHLL
jgi:hypothetical protein